MKFIIVAGCLKAFLGTIAWNESTLRQQRVIS